MRRVGDRPVACDLAIVGAGITGACVAHALARPGYRVVVLDRRAPATGSTAASTALVTHELDLPLTRLARRLGTGEAVDRWWDALRAVDRLRETILAERIACAWEDRTSLYLAGSDLGARALRNEAEARRRAGLPAEFLDREELARRYALARDGAILSGGAGVVDPVRLTAGLLRRAVRRGARLHSPADVRTVEPRGSEVRLSLDGGGVVDAKQAVFCAGYELLPGLRIRGHDVDATWAIASAPGARYPAWLDRTIVWEASSPYLYLRTTPDRRLIAGGEDEPAADAHERAGTLERKGDRIAAKVATLLPEARFRTALRWGGRFGVSRSGLPVIDRVPGVPGCFAVLGFGGNGITHAALAPEILRPLLEGRALRPPKGYRVPRR